MHKSLSYFLPFLLYCYKNILHVDFTSFLSFANHNLSALDVPSVCAPIDHYQLNDDAVGVKTFFIIYHY